MDEQIVKFRVGVMVTASLLIAAILIVMFSGPSGLLGGKYTIYAEADEAPGVAASTPIHKSGILIGRVAKVKLLDEGGVLMTLRIDDDKRLRHNEICEISGTLLGDAELRFIRDIDPAAPKTLIKPGETVKAVVRDDPVEVISQLQDGLNRTIGSVSKTSEDMGTVIRQISNLLEQNETRINSILTQMDESLGIMKDAVSNTNDIVGDPELRDKLKQTIEEMPEVLKRTQETAEEMKKAFQAVERNLNNIEDFTEPLGRHGPQLVDRIDGAVQNLEQLSSEMVKFSRAINSEEGSLGQFVHNPDLYQNLNKAARNIQDVSTQLRPIVRDARIFSDKIARHPGVIVRDAIRPGDGLK